MGLPFNQLMAVIRRDAVIPEIPAVITADNAQFANVPVGQAPANKFTYINNTFNKGAFVNGVDYISRLTALQSTFPNGCVMDWSWPAAAANPAGFCYGYPEIFFGGGPSGYPHSVTGPGPTQASAFTALSVTFDISLAGNLNSFDVLLDIYTQASPSTTDGTHSREISIYPYSNEPNTAAGAPLTNIQTFSSGLWSVMLDPSSPEIYVRPCDASGHNRTILSGTINLKEIIDYLRTAIEPRTGQTFINGAHYILGAEFGIEPQMPNTYNSTPHSGSMSINHLSYVWG